jgi:hypothetical protein
MTDSEFPRHGRRGGDPPPEAAAPDDSFADVFNRFTFDSGRSRRRRRKDPEPAEEPETVERERPLEDPHVSGFPSRQAAPAEQPPPEPDPGAAPVGPPPPGWGSRPLQPGPRTDVSWGSQPPPPPAVDAAQPPLPDPGEAPASSVRSYAWTGGRTKSNYKLELETLVSTSEVYRSGPMVRHEHQSIADLCQHPRSVAEVGALLGVPVGVARVLLADMAELGWITVHHTVSDGGSAPHLMLMERVLSGLRRL